MKTLLTAAAFALLSVTTAFGQVTVKGTGTVQGKPDVAYITVAVQSDAVTATDAMNNNKSMDKVLKALNELGLKDEDIKTNQVSLAPQYKYKKDEQPELYGYAASNTINVTVNDLKLTGKVFETVVKSGSNRLDGLHFGVKDSSKLLDEAKVKAVKDARRTADLYAGAGGVKLGKLKSLTEGSALMPRPQVLRAAPMSEDRSETPVAPGTLTFTVSVTAVFDVE